MSIFGPCISWTPSTPSIHDINQFKPAPKATTPCPPYVHTPCSLDNYADPPEMPDDVKNHGLKGLPCLYGFEFRDAAVEAYDNARGIERPEGRDMRSWMARRKRDIMNGHARELGMRFSAHLAIHSVVNSGTLGACQEDVVHFAYVAQGQLVKSQCLTTQKIKELMLAMEIDAEPHWIMV